MTVARDDKGRFVSKSDETGSDQSSDAAAGVGFDRTPPTSQIPHWAMTPLQYERALEQGMIVEHDDEIDPYIDPEAMAGQLSLSTALCKLWRFFAKVVAAVVDGVSGILKNLGKAVISLLSSLFDAAADAIGGFLENLLKNPLALVGVGLLAWWLIGGKKSTAEEDAKEDEEERQKERKFKREQAQRARDAANASPGSA